MNQTVRFATVLLALSTTVLTALAVEPQPVLLSSLGLAPIVQGWGKPMADKSVTGQPLSIAGRKFEHGVGTHADSSIWLDLAGGTERFSAWVGVDDDATNRAASIRFQAVADGKTIWKTGVMHLGDPAQKVDLDLKGVQKLLLAVDMAGDGGLYDHADWAEASLLVARAQPKIIAAPAETAVILTPKPPREPRINGARIFGVRPGHPFLFTIPATGERPMSFAVEGLPNGLAVDPVSGQITGRLPQPGDYSVFFRASNIFGLARRPFKIVCGDTLALTPHMGWNSWYVWTSRVTDKIMREAADAMVSSGMINHGYQYVNIDDCWAVKPGSTNSNLGGEPRDAEGRVNANGNFPDMKALTDYIHSKGLKAGIYTSPGPLTCARYVGAYEHELLDAQRFADWGFDFLKYDWCSYGKIAQGNALAELQKPYRLMGQILRQQNRDMVLNLCQYGNGKVWQWGKEVGGQSWRTAGDLGGARGGIAAGIYREALDLYASDELDRYGGPGAWNDPDYLLLGYLAKGPNRSGPTTLTPNEQYTHVSFWCLVAAPLIFSGDISRLDDFTMNLLSNDEVIEVDQDPLGKPGHRAARHGDGEVWVKDMEDGSKVVGLFNRGEMPATVTAQWSELGLTGKQRARDLWRQQDLGACAGQFAREVPRHGVVFVRLWGQP